MNCRNCGKEVIDRCCEFCQIFNERFDDIFTFSYKGYEVFCYPLKNIVAVVDIYSYEEIFKFEFNNFKVKQIKDKINKLELLL